MVTAVKHGEARTIINRCPFYITTTQVPKFGSHDLNVKRRIVVFETKSLPKTDTKAEDWIGRNAMKLNPKNSDMKIRQLETLINK